MGPTFRPTDAFVDESIRGQRYLLACVLAEGRHLGEARAVLSGLAPVGKRIHFYEGTDRTRRRAVDVFLTLRVEVLMAVCVRGNGVTEFHARDACLAELVRRLQLASVRNLTIESRQFDGDDHRTIHRSRNKEPTLHFNHVVGDREPMLWIADGVAWAYGAGGRWRTLVAPIISNVIEIRP